MLSGRSAICRGSVPIRVASAVAIESTTSRGGFPPGAPVHFPVNAVLPGRRNNPAGSVKSVPSRMNKAKLMGLSIRKEV